MVRLAHRLSHIHLDPGSVVLRMSCSGPVDAAPVGADSAKLNDDMHPARGDSTMIDCRRTAAVLAAVGVLGVAACGADPKVLTSYTCLLYTSDAADE